MYSATCGREKKTVSVISNAFGFERSRIAQLVRWQSRHHCRPINQFVNYYSPVTGCVRWSGLKPLLCQLALLNQQLRQFMSFPDCARRHKAGRILMIQLLPSPAKYTVERIILATLNFGVWVNVIILDPVILAFLLATLKHYCIQIFAACYFRELARLAKFAK